MHDHRHVPLQVALQGVLSGMVGALALTAMVAAVRNAKYVRNRTDAPMDRPGISAAEALADGPDRPPQMNYLTATFVQKIATGIFGASLSANQQYVAGTLWHLFYGGSWGMLYALLQSSVSVPKLVLGPIFGFGVWAVGPGWLVPRMKLMLPPSQQQPHTSMMVVGIHTAYGAIVALVFNLLHGSDHL